ncbi:MalY/PatB family protein [Streptomyces sp. NPDC021969]|uniref:MalY/PatB family protein n=1 Tax=unclassified Streptomyces TaxID=2593676 RepID=UPI0033E4929D
MTTPPPAPYDFDTPVDRRGTWCTQWDYVQDRFGVPDLLPFTISDMDFETAPAVLVALRRRLDHGVLGYSRWRQDDFLSAIVHWYASRHGTTVDPGSVVYAPSVIYQVSRLLHLWSRPGDGVVAHTPMYDAFPRTVAASGRRLLECPLDDWPELERLLALPDTAVLLLCSPHNPTGRVWSAAELDRMARLCARHGVAVVSDEIHSDLAHAPHVHRPWVRHGGDGRWAVVTSASKSFNIPALTGSYGIIGDPASRDAYLRQLKDADGLSSPAVLSLVGHIAAYREGAPWLDALRTYLAGNLATVADRLREAFPGLDWRPPQAGYLAWIDLRPLDVDDEELQRELVEVEKVAVMPGAAYGSPGRVRLNVGCPRSKAEAGVEALVRALGRLTRTERRRASALRNTTHST